MRMKSKVSEASSWLERNPRVEKMEYEVKLKELEDVCAPMAQKLTHQTVGGIPPDGAVSTKHVTETGHHVTTIAGSNEATAGAPPFIEEVD